MSTNTGSATPSAERGRVRRVALVTHGRVGQVEDGVERLAALAVAQGVELLVGEDEAGRADGPKGVVRDPEVHRRVLGDFCATAASWGARVAGVVDSGHPGPKGNREFLVHLTDSREPTDPDELDRWIDDAVG